jgi:multicomponent Na+:H+ antiporter subunit D
MIESLPSWTPAWACLVSLVAAGLIMASGKSPNRREGITLVAGLLKFGLVASMLPVVLSGKVISCTLVEFLPGLPIAFRVDGLGLLFALVASSLWILTSLYGIGYMRGLKEQAQTRFFTCFAVALSATLGAAFSANLLTLYIFYEILSLSTWPLVTHHQDAEAKSGGRKYLTYLLGTSIGLVLPAMIYIQLKTGSSMSFGSHGFLAGHIGETEALVLLLMFLFGFAKAGLMPFHSWLPGAMVAPTPVSALLHAVAVVKVGVFCIIRVVTGVFGTAYLAELNLGILIAWIAAFTVIVSSLIALSQDSLKRRLAFSTVGQLAYIILGIALLTEKGMTGSMMHIGMHAFGKITLFFCAGAIYVASGKKYISEMTGIGFAMPITMSAFFIGSLSVVGMPLGGGFLSKLYLLWGTAQAGELALTAVFLVSSFLNAAYFFPIVFNAFFCAPENRLFGNRVKEAPFLCVLPLSLTALASVILFFYPEPFFKLASLMVSQILGNN